MHQDWPLRPNSTPRRFAVVRSTALKALAQVECGAKDFSDALLTAALSYAERGWLVSLLHSIRNDGGCTCGKSDCTSPGKHPRTLHGVKDATAEFEQIHRWWALWPDANIGIATGAASGLVVVDLDGNIGRENFLELLQPHGLDLETLMAHTGGDGCHLLFEYPGVPIKNDTGKKLGAGIDVRGDGGYIVAPPSLHVSGNRYRWSDVDVPPAKLPEWLLQRLVAPPQLSVTPTNGSGVIPDGQRNSTLASLAGTMRRKGMGEHSIMAALQEENSARCQPPLPETEVAAIAASICRYEPTDTPGMKVREKRQFIKANRTAEPVSHTVAASDGDGAALVQDVLTFYKRFLILPPATALPLAIWTIATYIYDVFDAFPYLTVLSPVKRCGKTRLTEVAELVASNARLTVNISEAALFRLIHSAAPTLVLDEAEALSGRSERGEAIRSLLNAGNRRGATVPRCVGKSNEIQEFSVYCPKMICGIRVCPDTIRDRSIVIWMQRRKSDEKVARFRRRVVAQEASALRARIVAFLDLYRNEIAALYDWMDLPFLEDRDEEAWQPFFAILSLADPTQLDALRAAAEMLTRKKGESDKDDSLSMKLLSDLRDVFGDRKEMPTEDIIAALRRLDESPWGHGEELTPGKLAWMVKPFGVKPRQVWHEGKNLRGYTLADLADAFARYLG